MRKMNPLLPLLAVALTACLRVATSPLPLETTMRDVNVLDSHMAYREAGRGPPVVLLHGNPTSSYVWRDVIPHLSDRYQVLAPDLIGMGDSGKPDIAYRFADHSRYLDAWFDALDLQDVVLVGYDWGGSLAMDWAARHPDRVRGLVVYETFLRSLKWSDYPPQGAELFKNLRTPGVGETLVLEQNQFLARSLGVGVKRGLTAAEAAVYAAPYPDASSRRPLLAWPREIPIENQPADMTAVLERYVAWMGASPEVPKLLLTFDSPTPLGAPSVVEWAQGRFANLEVVTLGEAGHHASEDLPDDIGRAIAHWLHRLAHSQEAGRNTASRR
ncbi:haloalkane dehalogenase [Myxococcus xanthus]|uniref:haloalkane dehalogenase n=1 Tax=Myxococcus xanthus TaxID=34 RepID=UPI001F00931B|nr:haloalkane dehalogenase [Myxococcus xanthus]